MVFRLRVNGDNTEQTDGQTDGVKNTTHIALQERYGGNRPDSCIFGKLLKSRSMNLDTDHTTEN